MLNYNLILNHCNYIVNICLYKFNSIGYIIGIYIIGVVKMYNFKIIKSRIIESGYTQKEIAKELGITEVTLSKWSFNSL